TGRGGRADGPAVRAPELDLRGRWTVQSVRQEPRGPAAPAEGTTGGRSAPGVQGEGGREEAPQHGRDRHARDQPGLLVPGAAEPVNGTGIPRPASREPLRTGA